jgi:hypothetical protein
MNARLSRRLIMFGVPLVLGLLELGHPALLPRRRHRRDHRSDRDIVDNPSRPASSALCTPRSFGFPSGP